MRIPQFFADCWENLSNLQDKRPLNGMERDYCTCNDCYGFWQ